MDPFIQLTMKLTNPKLKVEDKLKEICRTTSVVIQGADRVSLWLFSEDFESIEALICFEVASNSFSSGQLLTKANYGKYFEGILHNDIINAPQAREHELTQCFNETYLLPNNIYSILDYILHRDFAPHGIICCESVGKSTQWSESNLESLKRIARASSLYFKFDD